MVDTWADTEYNSVYIRVNIGCPWLPIILAPGTVWQCGTEEQLESVVQCNIVV